MVIISSQERRNSFFVATLAKEAGRHEEAYNLVKKLASLDFELTSEEQRLLSITLKHVINARRSALVSLSSSSEEVGKISSTIKLMNTSYKNMIESELSTICSDMIDMIDEHLLPLSSTKESTAFYYKLKGDCYRYVLEYLKTSGSGERKEAVDGALEAYKEATSIASSELSPAHPTRLGLGLNFSVFYFEIMKLPMEACFLAREVLDEADAVIDNLIEEEAHEESNLLMKLLKENISLYASDITEKDLAVYTRRVQNHSKVLGGN